MSFLIENDMRQIVSQVEDEFSGEVQELSIRLRPYLPSSALNSRPDYFGKDKFIGSQKQALESP